MLNGIIQTSTFVFVAFTVLCGSYFIAPTVLPNRCDRVHDDVGSKAIATGCGYVVSRQHGALRYLHINHVKCALSLSTLSPSRFQCVPAKLHSLHQWSG